MATKRFHFNGTQSAMSVRVFDDDGDVCDFGDEVSGLYQFKSWPGGSYTTDHKDCTKITDAFGTGNHGYYVDIDLDKINPTGERKQYRIAAYGSTTPAETDNPVSGVGELPVQFGNSRFVNPVVRWAMTYQPTGDKALLMVWLEVDGKKYDIDGLDAAATCSFSVWPHEAGAALFTKAGAASDLRNDIFELEQTNPNFTDNTPHFVTASITANGITFNQSSQDAGLPVFGD